MTANAEILLDEHKGVLTVPENAVSTTTRRMRRWRFRTRSRRTARARLPVKVGLSNGSVTEILSGLKEGDQVVLQQ